MPAATQTTLLTDTNSFININSAVCRCCVIGGSFFEMEFNNKNGEVLYCPDGQFSATVIVPKNAPVGSTHTAPYYFGDWDDIESSEIDYGQTKEVIVLLAPGDTLFSDYGLELMRFAQPVNPMD